MQKKFDFQSTAALIEEVAGDLREDILNDAFVDGATVSWLAHKPSTLKEAAENLYERLRAVGITMCIDRNKFVSDIVSSNLSDLAAEDIPKAVNWLPIAREWDSSFDSADIDHRAVGEAAFLRSDYRKQNGE